MHIEPQMSKLSVRDMLEAKERLEADIGKLLDGFHALTGLDAEGIEIVGGDKWTLVTFGGQIQPVPREPAQVTVRIEL